VHEPPTQIILEPIDPPTFMPAKDREKAADKSEHPLSKNEADNQAQEGQSPKNPRPAGHHGQSLPPKTPQRLYLVWFQAALRRNRKDHSAVYA
jgi:hypothetical protein